MFSAVLSTEFYGSLLLCMHEPESGRGATDFIVSVT